jgi:hypothetical protein
VSRYVAVTLEIHGLDEVAAGLRRLGLVFERGRERVMLEGSLECTGEPVDIRLAAGTLDAVEDFGFVRDGDRVRLVCGELDAERLQQELLVPLRAAVVQQRLEAAGLRVDAVEVGPDGVHRIVVSEE